MIGSLVFTIVFNVIVVVSFYLTRVILSKYLSPSGTSLTFDRWPHRVSWLCDFRVISSDFVVLSCHLTRFRRFEPFSEGF